MARAPRNLDYDLGVCLLMISGTVEVAQQSKARRKDDFLIAFSPVIAEATATAYKGATNEVQQKLRRVVEVWRQRQIFEIPIQEAIESRIDGRMHDSILITITYISRTRQISIFWQACWRLDLLCKSQCRTERARSLDCSPAKSFEARPFDKDLCQCC